MRMRPLVVCSLVLAVAATSPAVADPKKKKKKKPQPLCYLLVDDKGDAPSPAMDIHSADVATGNNTVVAVIRLATTDSEGDPLATLGLTWAFTFKVRGERYSFTRRRVSGMEERYTYGFSPNPKNVKPTVTETATEVRWVIPRAGVPELMKRGQWVLDTLAANGTMFVTNADHSASDKTYPDKHPHCLNPK